MKTKLLTTLLCFLPLFAFSQNYEKEGDDLFAQAQYEKAEKKYKAALLIMGETPSILQKQINCSKCKTLLIKAQTAGQASRYSEAAKYYEDLYALHSLSKYQVQANTMKQMAKRIEAERHAKLEVETEDMVYVIVQKWPVFPGGQVALSKYFDENVKCPINAYNEEIKGRVICQFVVNKDGSIVNIEIARSSGNALLDEEAIRVVKSMPRWSPGVQNGEVVRVKYTLPINFK